MDVFAGGEVHQRVAAPFDGPAHFLDLFVNGGGDGGVADVGVDFDEEVASDDHRLELGVVDVGRDDGAAAGDFVAHELGSDFAREAGAEGLAGVLDEEGVAGGGGGSGDGFAGSIEASVFAEGDILHLGGDEAALGVVELGDDFAGFGAEDGAVAAVEDGELVFGGAEAGGGGVGFGEIAIVLGAVGTAGDFLDIAALADPGIAHEGEAALDVAVEGGVAPGAGGVVNADGLVDLDGAVGAFGGGEGDFAQGDAEVGAGAGEVNALGGRTKRMSGGVLLCSRI